MDSLRWLNLYIFLIGVILWSRGDRWFGWPKTTLYIATLGAVSAAILVARIITTLVE